MRSFFITFEKWFARFSSIYVLIILLCTIRVNYYVYLPGNLTNVQREIEIADTSYEIDGSVSSIYVVDITRPTLFTFLIVKNLPYAEVIEMTDTQASSLDQNLDYAVGTLQSNLSFSNAELAAYELLGDKVDFSYHSVTILYKATKEVESSMSYTDLVGKIIYSYPDSGTYPSLSEVSLYLSTIPVGSDAILTLENSSGNKEDVSITKRSTESGNIFGITIMTSYVIDESDNDVSVMNVYTTGPSGGAMQALYIYLTINGVDILNGRKISGTGTIGYELDDEGNFLTFEKVGAIGCVGQKLYAAYLDHADVFYCPADNYEECMEAFSKYGFTENDIRVVEVSYLSDIVNDLLENPND